MVTPVRIKRFRPGDEADTYCGRCKAERAHQVVALNADGTPATVICRTCGGQHRYREKKVSAPPPAQRNERGSRRTVERAREAPAGPARRYSPTEVYAVGELVDHPKFGPGEVTRARGGKIEVRFESGTRLLIHAG